MKNILLAILLLTSTAAFAQEIELEVIIVEPADVAATVELGIHCASFYTIAAFVAEQKHPTSPAIAKNLLVRAGQSLDIAKSWSLESEHALVEQRYSADVERMVNTAPADIKEEFASYDTDCPSLLENGRKL